MTTSGNPFVGLQAGDTIELPEGERFGKAGHLWQQEEIDALILAWAARRPLLVRGEAGCGKSQMARAAAHHLYGGEPLVEVIHARFEALDLLYRFDLVARLADAQAGALAPTNDPYVKRGALWEAMAEEAPKPPAVLLIDEIDKADAEVPNALLEVLGNRSFTVPPLGNRVVGRNGDRQPPLVVITTNEERELPAAFIRRCVVLNLNPPKDEPGLFSWLVERGKVHPHKHIVEAVRHEAARQVVEDRRNALEAGYPPVGLAEYMDLLTALDDLTKSEAPEAREQAQVDWLKRLSPYALMKHPEQSQKRSSEGSGAAS